MLTMVIETTNEMAPIYWTMVAGLCASAGIIVGACLPERWSARFSPVKLATAGGTIGYALALLLAA